MAQRNPARLVNNRGNTIRYDVVWMLPFNDFTRIGYGENQTWWLDSIHTGEIQGRKRFNAIKNAVKANNGSIVLFEIMTNSSLSTFNQRAILRAGRELQPPPISEINPVTVDVDASFRDLHAQFERRHQRVDTTDAPLPRAAISRRKPPKPSRAPAIMISLFGGLIAAIAVAAYINYTPPPVNPGAGMKGFGVRGAAARETNLTYTTERPEQRIIIPLRGDPERRCEYYTMHNQSMEYRGKGACPQTSP